jgi:hypothetical protein
MRLAGLWSTFYVLGAVVVMTADTTCGVWCLVCGPERNGRAFALFRVVFSFQFSVWQREKKKCENAKTANLSDEESIEDRIYT